VQLLNPEQLKAVTEHTTRSERARG
jgi:hypothetical protein